MLNAKVEHLSTMRNAQNHYQHSEVGITFFQIHIPIRLQQSYMWHISFYRTNTMKIHIENDCAILT